MRQLHGGSPSSALFSQHLQQQQQQHSAIMGAVTKWQSLDKEQQMGCRKRRQQSRSRMADTMLSLGGGGGATRQLLPELGWIICRHKQC
jgi:hypothetical protein